MRKYVLFFAFCSALVPALALASAPSVSSYKADPMTASYGFGTVLSWNISGGNTPDFYITCPSGVTVKKDVSTIVPCNALVTLGTLSLDSASLSFVNLTGSTANVSFRLIPKDFAGVSYPDLLQTITIPVGAVPQPITSFATSSSTPDSGSLVTLTWTGIETPGVNMQFDCGSDIKAYTDITNQFSALPCGKPAFVSDLAQSGSQPLYFVNSSLFAEQMNVRVFPSVTPGNYDGMHGVSLSLFVKGTTVAPDPSVLTFTSSNSSVSSGNETVITWGIKNASGANLQFACADGVSAVAVGTTTTPIPCGRPAFSTPLSAAGSVTVQFSSIQPVPRSVSVLLLPYTTFYDATKGQTLVVTVLPQGSVAPITAPTTNTTTSTNTATVGRQIAAVRTLVFSVAMQKGSHGAQVTALQKFLAEDPALYPEGTVTGYLGPATLAALERFQVRYGVAKAGDAGYGLVGPKTRAKLNSLTTF